MFQHILRSQIPASNKETNEITHKISPFRIQPSEKDGGILNSFIGSEKNLVYFTLNETLSSSFPTSKQASFHFAGPNNPRALLEKP